MSTTTSPPCTSCAASRAAGVWSWCRSICTREHTYEDPSLTRPADRERAFLQRDHVRLYAPDIEQRLRKAGFQVQCIEPEREFGAATMARCRLERSDYMWLCHPG